MTSKLITCFIGGFTLTMKPQSIAHLLNGNEHIYWILDLAGEVHSIWDLWVSGLKECKSNEFLWNRAGGWAAIFSWVQKISIFWTDGCPCPIMTLRKVHGGYLTSPMTYVANAHRIWRFGGLFYKMGSNMYTSWNGNDAIDNTHADELDAMLKLS